MDADGGAQMILLLGILGVLLAMMVLLGTISRSLLRMEKRLAERQVAPGQVHDSPRLASSMSHPSPAMMKRIAKESDFMVFLAEDKTRRNLPKREQFSAYRQWRKEKGLNWPHGPEPSEG